MKKILNSKGQGLMEYMIISGLIGIFCLGAVQIYGKTIKKKLYDMKEKVNEDMNVKKW